MHRRISQAAAVIVILALLITGCTSQASNIGMAKDRENGAVDTGFTVTTVGSYDSADTAVVVSSDQQNKNVTFMNMDTGKQYTLYYDGTTYIKDKYGSPMSISQIRQGDVVDVNFLKGKRQIASMQLSPAAWVYENVVNYDLGGINKTASIGSTTYSLPDDVVVLSEGQRVEVMDIVMQDVVSIQGIDHEIYSINVERGHGYLRLKNDQPLIGGWIEVGNSVIREITEDMLLVVPEGEYQVLLTNNGASCTKSIIVERDKEIVLDVGDLEIPEDKTGRILFTVTPESAKVTIDHEEVDISRAVELPYGIHQVHLEAAGYDSLTKYIQVGSEYAKISFTLEEQKEDESNYPTISQNDIEEEEPDVLTEEDKPKSNNSISSNTLPSVSDNTVKPSTGNKVYIDSPKGVEVYLDSVYVGVAPVSFKKEAGRHTITLRKSGYKTKSYTIYLYNDKEDITYSFTDLEKEQTEQKPSVSDNTTSNDTTGDKCSHNYTEEVTKEPSCTEAGVRTYTCKICKHTYTVEIKPIPHDFDENGICKKCRQIGPDHTHDYEDGKCTTCGEEHQQHEYENGKCTVCGVEHQPHEYDENGKCMCGVEKPGEHQHDYKETVTTEASCTEKGVKTYTCDCGDSYTEDIPAMGHNYAGGECTICGAEDPSDPPPDPPNPDESNTNPPVPDEGSHSENTTDSGE